MHWHPQKSLVISGSKDNQQPVKLWDPKTGQSLATLHAHKSTVMDVKWNENGNWLVTASRDHLLKLFDIRNLSQEVQTFRGHKKEASSVAWHPSHEGLFCSGGSDGAILFWHVGYVLSFQGLTPHKTSYSRCSSRSPGALSRDSGRIKDDTGCLVSYLSFFS